MNDRLSPPPSALQAQAQAQEPELAAVRVDRATTELKHGRAVRVCDAGDTASAAALVVAAVESLTATRFGWFAALGVPMQLLLGGDRRHALDAPSLAAGPMRIDLSPGATFDDVMQLAAVTPLGEPQPDVPARLRSGTPPASADTPAMLSALQLARRARLAPALLMVVEQPAVAPQVAAAQLLAVSGTDLRQTQGAVIPTLRRISDAHVPLAAREDCELALFREENGGAEHLAIIVGQPDLSQPVPVRLHSSCLTGDLLGSLRCDCGDQLRRAVERLAVDGGVLLYLEQEGRSIGLANKLRAYRLQDAGLDTLDADHHLGFAADERDYGAAVAMLRELGISRIRLLTNNPKKIDALAAGGIEVVERLSLHAPVNVHNARYIETKQQRAGHLKDD
jgi:GTP cyclohydrolase II